MAMTDPFVTLVPRKMTDTELARAIRLNIAAEIDAINLYAAHMDATDNEAARRMLAHIIEEEKEHLAEFLELLKMLDPDQARELGTASAKVEEILGGQAPPAPESEEAVEVAEVVSDPGPDPAPQERPSMNRQPTVGSLRTPKG